MPDGYHWRIPSVVTIPQDEDPIDTPGRLGFWTPPDPVLDQLVARFARLGVTA